MPKLPTYDSQRNITSQQPQFMAAENADAKIAGVAAEGLGKVADVAVDTTKKWADAVDTIQTTTAKANYETGALSIMAKAEADPNYNNSDTYKKDLATLKDNSLQGFSNNITKARMAFELDHANNIAGIKIDGMYRKKIVAVGQVNSQRLIDNKIQNNALSVQDKEAFIKDELNTQIAAGIFSPEEAYKIEKDAVKKSKNASFISDLESNPSVAEKKLASNEYQFDIEQLAKAKDQYDRELNKIQNVQEEDVIDQHLNNNLTVDQVKQLRKDKKISGKFAESMITKINRGENVKTDPWVYMNAVDTVLSQDMTAKAKREYLMDLLKNNQISDWDFKSLYRNKVSGYPSVAETYMAEKMTEEEAAQKGASENPNMSYLRSAVGLLQNSGILSPAALPAATMRLFNVISRDNLEGKSIPQVAKQILTEVAISQLPALSLKKDIPNGIFQNGQAKIIHRGDSDIEVNKQYQRQKKDYDVGDTEVIGGVSYRVVGHDTDGEPLIEEE